MTMEMNSWGRNFRNYSPATTSKADPQQYKTPQPNPSLNASTSP
ncbi:hypothetical protein ACHAW6_009393 [Cyclotella cf. meneghiniana]